MDVCVQDYCVYLGVWENDTLSFSYGVPVFGRPWGVALLRTTV